MKKLTSLFLTLFVVTALLLLSCDTEDVSSDGDINNTSSIDESSVISEISDNVSSGAVAEDAPEEYIDEQRFRYVKSYTSDYYYLDGTTDSSYLEEIKEIVVPEEIHGLPVVMLGDYAFSGAFSVEKITLPDTLKIISDGVFLSNIALQEIRIPDSVEYIGDEVFRNCSSIKEIYFPASVITIGNAALRDTIGLETITVEKGNIRYHSESNCLVETATKTIIAGCMKSVIPDNGSVQYIGDNAFYGCKNLKSIEIPDTIKKIGDAAFCGCDGLTSIELKAAIEHIGGYAFSGCENLESVSMKDCNIYAIEPHTFFGCISLKSIEIPTAAKVINSMAFYECTALESVDFGSGNLSKICDYAFGACNSLEIIRFPETLRIIENNVFEHCGNLKEIYIPASAQDMGEYLCWSCDQDIDIYVVFEQKPDSWDENWDKVNKGEVAENITVYWRTFG